MKPEELQAIRERVNNATPGPWKWGFVEDSVWPQRLCTDAADFGYVFEACEAADSDDEAFGLDVIDIKDEDMEFIAHIREDAPKLLDEIERLRDALVNVRKKIGDFEEPWNRREYEVDEIARQALAGDSE